MKTKILIATATALLFILTSNAQIAKNTWMAGGMAQYNSNSFKQSSSFNNKYRTAVLDLSIGYTFKENQVVGITALYAPARYTYTTGTAQTEQKAHSKGVGAFYRLYHPLGNKFYVYGQASGLYANVQQRDNDYRMKTNTASLAIAPGLSYAISNNVHVELAIPNLVQLKHSKSESKIAEQPVIPGKEEFTVKSSLSSGLLKELGVGFKIFF